MHKLVQFLAERVQDVNNCESFECNQAFWVLEETKGVKTEFGAGNVLTIVEQVGTCSLSFKRAYGRYTKKKFLTTHPYFRSETFGLTDVFTVRAMEGSGAKPFTPGKPLRSQVLTRDDASSKQESPSSALTRSIVQALKDSTDSTMIVDTRIAKKAKPATDENVAEQLQSTTSVVSPMADTRNVDGNCSGSLDLNHLGNPIPLAKQLDSSIVDDIIHQLRSDKSQQKVSSQLQTLAHLVINRCTNDGIVTLNCTNTVKRSYTAKYAPMAKERKAESQLEGGRRHPRTIAKKAATLSQYFQIGTRDDAVLTALAEHLGYSVFLTSSLQLKDYDIIALRDYIGTSMRGISRMSQFMKTKKLPMIFPPNFVRLVAAYEAKGGPSFTTIQVPLYVNIREDKKQYCTFWYDRDPYRVAEDILSRAIMEGKFDNSFLFSALNNKFVLVFGGDKGGDMFSMLIRTANRKDGNSATYSQVLAQYEDGAECYDNLKITVYSKAYPVRGFIQLLLDDALIALAFKVQDRDGNRVDCRSSLLQIADLGKKSNFIPKDVSFELDSKRQEDNTVIQDVIPEIDGRPRKIIEVPIDVGDGHLKLTVHLVKASPEDLSFSAAVESTDEENGTKFFSGFRVAYDSNVIESFRWARNKILRVPIGTSVLVDQYHTMGFPSNDTKQSLIVSGIGSPSSSCSCLVCMARSTDFTSSLPTWQAEFKDDADEPSLQYGPDAPIREGTLSYRKCYERYAVETGDGLYAKSYEASMVDKRASGSVVHEPLADVPPAKESMSPMHASQGVFTHFSDSLRSRLHDIDKQGPWMKEVGKVMEAAEQMIVKDDNWRVEHKASLEFDKQRIVLEKKKLAEKDTNSVLKLSEEITTNKSVKMEHAKTSEYGKNNLLRTGAKELLADIKKYLKSKKPKGPAEYHFNRSIELHANVRYQAQHSGFELTNKDGLKALDKWDDICESTALSYPRDSSTIQKQIVQLMKESKTIAGPLLQLSKLLKSQEKFNDQRLRTLKVAIARLSKAWRKALPGKDVFIKLHHIECHMLSFVMLYRMVGRLSEEGFEACHPTLNAVQKILKSIVNTQQRITTMGRRFNVRSDDNVQSVISEIKTKTQGPKRGKYNKTINLRVSENLEHVECGTLRASIEYPGHALISTGGLIPDAWVDVKLMAAFGRVPASWSNSFQACPGIGQSQQQKAKFFKG